MGRGHSSSISDGTTQPTPPPPLFPLSCSAQQGRPHQPHDNDEDDDEKFKPGLSARRVMMLLRTEFPVHKFQKEMKAWVDEKVKVLKLPMAAAPAPAVGGGGKKRMKN